MKKTLILAIACIVCATLNVQAGGRVVRYGYPTKDLVYKFEVYTGEKDRWDSRT